jgi:hypothetical protein
MKLTHHLRCARRFFAPGAVSLLLTGIFYVFPTLCLSQQTYSVQVEKGSLEAAIVQVRKATAAVIAYNPSDIARLQVAAATYTQLSPEQLLKKLIAGLPLKLQKEGTTYILLKTAATAEPAKTKDAFPKKHPGKITGRIMDEENNLPVTGATVQIGKETVISDTNGVFTISLPKGRYEAAIIAVGYGTKKITDLFVKESGDFILDIPLKREKGQLGAVTVSARHIKETTTNLAIVNEIRESRAVINGISKEQISRSQDRDAAEVVRRIPGVSVIQNRFVVIRGMGQRYNTVMLNNAIAPSFEPDSKAFSFDIIPSGMIDRIMVYKTAVPELPGDFAGGLVKIYTTGLPVKNSFTINYSASYRPGSTFQDFYGQKDGKYAWLGYDDGTYKRPIDAYLPYNSPFDLRMEATRKFNRNWQAENKGPASPDQRFSMDYAHRFSLSNKTRFGIVGGLGYVYTKQNQVQYRNPSGMGGFIRYTATDELQERDVRLSGLVNLSLDIGDHHHFSFKNLYTHLGSTRYMHRRGYLPYDAMSEVGIPVGDNLEQFVLTNDYRGIYTGQVNGSHELFKGNTKIHWLAARTQSNLYSPDERRRTHSADAGTVNWKPWFSPAMGLGTEGREQRVYMNGAERVKTLGLDLEQKININSFQPLLKAGFYWEDKTKSANYMSFAHIDSALAGGGAAAYNVYEAYNILKAGYIAAEIPVLKKLKLYGGIRIEDNLQHLGTTSRDVVGPNVGPILLNLHKTTVLPSVNLSYNLAEKTLLRAAYYKTLNRPEFREISAIYYYDMANNSYVHGNPNLLPQADIDNIDLRLEHYPGPGEMISFAVFHKKITNPYELYGNSSSSGVAYIWRNSETARNYGAEVDVMLGLGRYFTGLSWASRQAQKLSLLFNASYIYSRLELGEAQRDQQYVDHRPLMGQSPYLVNTGLNYTDDATALKVNVSYNIIGKRIAMIGTQELATVWELPRHSLDFTFSKRLGKALELKGGVQNILNSRFVFAQDMNMDGKFDIVNTDYELLSHKMHDNRYQSYFQRAYFTLGVGVTL